MQIRASPSAPVQLFFQIKRQIMSDHKYNVFNVNTRKKRMISTQNGYEWISVSWGYIFTSSVAVAYAGT